MYCHCHHGDIIYGYFFHVIVVDSLLILMLQVGAMADFKYSYRKKSINPLICLTFIQL